jgi:PAS domain S-box-containing protein
VEVIKLGAFDFMEKPTNLANIARSIERAATHSEAIREARAMSSMAEQWQATFDASPDLIIVMDREDRILRCNSATCRLLGMQKEEIAGHAFYEVFGCQDGLLDGLATNGTSSLKESRVAKFFYKRFGQYFKEVLVSLKNHSGQPWGRMLVLRDVTELKEAQQALQQRLDFEKVASTISSRFVGSGDLDAPIQQSLADLGRFIGMRRAVVYRCQDGKSKMVMSHEWCDKGTEPLTQEFRELDCKTYSWLMNRLFRREWICVKNVDEMPAEAGAERKIFSAVGTQAILAMPIYSSDKLEGFLALSSIEKREFSDDDVSIVQISSNIIASALTRKEIEESALQLQLAIEQAAETIIIADLNGHIAYVNPAFETVTGYSREEAVDRHWRAFQFSEDEETFADLWNTVTAGKVWAGRGVNTRQDGTYYKADATVSPVRDDAGNIKAYVSVSRDVTKELELQSQLSQAQKLESIGQLAAGIAHEINTPTQYVGDNARFLKDSFQDFIDLLNNYGKLREAIKNEGTHAELISDLEEAIEEADLEYLLEEVPQAIDQSLEGIERVTKIVRAMKDFSHPGSQEKTPIDLNKSIDSTITVSRNEWKYVAELETEFSPDLPLVPCLPGELNQVILNLVINAAHAIGDSLPEGSDEKGKITVSTHLDGDCVEIRIADTGCGIPPEIQEKIFDPFFTTKEVGKGTGQGLAITRSVVIEKHGGDLRFETEQGKGTIFFIRLPINLP